MGARGLCWLWFNELRKSSTTMSIFLKFYAYLENTKKNKKIQNIQKKIKKSKIKNKNFPTKSCHHISQQRCQ
jgi:hypothetical protein